MSAKPRRHPRLEGSKGLSCRFNIVETTSSWVAIFDRGTGHVKRLDAIAQEDRIQLWNTAFTFKDNKRSGIDEQSAAIRFPGYLIAVVANAEYSQIFFS